MAKLTDGMVLSALMSCEAQPYSRTRHGVPTFTIKSAVLRLNPSTSITQDAVFRALERLTMAGKVVEVKSQLRYTRNWETAKHAEQREQSAQTEQSPIIQAIVIKALAGRRITAQPLGVDQVTLSTSAVEHLSLEHEALGVLVQWALRVLHEDDLAERYILMPEMVRRIGERFGPWSEAGEAHLMREIGP